MYTGYLRLVTTSTTVGPLKTFVRPCVRSITPPTNVSSAMSEVVAQYAIGFRFHTG